MKAHLFLVFFIMFVATDVFATNEMKGPYGVIKNYGVIDNKSKSPNVIKDKASPSGETRKYKFKDLQFLETTNKIPVRKGIRFGLSYEFRNLPVDKYVNFNLKVTHPKMQRPDGQITTEETYDRKLPVKNGQAYGGIAWLLKYNYELLPGEWGFEYIYEGKSILFHKFILYK